MAGINMVILSGRLTADATMRTAQGQNGEYSIATFTLAVNRIGKDAGADFIRCTAFGALADSIENWTGKGNRVTVSGRWQTGSYTDKDGNQHYTNDCIVDRLDIIDFRSDETNEGFEEVPVNDPPKEKRNRQRTGGNSRRR